MIKISAFLIAMGLYSSLAGAQVTTNSESYILPVPDKYDNFQNNDGTCYAYAAVNYINALAGLTDRMRIRPRTSMAVLALNESSNFLNAQINSKFVSNQNSVFNGGWPDELLKQYARNLESLIPVSEKLEWDLGPAVPIYEVPRSSGDTPRIRELISKKFYKYLSKSLKSRSLKQEAENYVLELEKMGLYMDHSLKKMVYQKPFQIIYNDLQIKLMEKNFGAINTSYLPTDQNSCINEAWRIITTSLFNDHPVIITIMIDEIYHAMLIYKITSTGSDSRVFIKNSWSSKPFLSMNLTNLCHPKAKTNLGFTLSLFEITKQ